MFHNGFDCFVEKFKNYFSGPFSFSDPSMESRYQIHRTSTAISRTRPYIANIFIPFAIIRRLVVVYYWTFYPRQLEFVDVFGNFLKIFALLVGASIYYVRWSVKTMLILGHALVWMNRVSGVLLAIDQHVHRSDEPFIALMNVVFSSCISGMITPSFGEYLVFALSVSFLRPLKLLSGSTTGLLDEGFQRLLFQHSLILALGLCITWAIHSDSRRDWLLLTPRASGKHMLPRSKPRPISESIHITGNRTLEYGNSDAYYSASELSEIVEMIKQERAEIEVRLQRGPDPVTRWHRSKDSVGPPGTGCVYQALNKLTGCLLAVKLIDRGSQDWLESQAAGAVLALSHPNIVRYFAPEIREGCICLLMEFCDGGCLSSILTHYGALPWHIIARYTSQVMAGLSYLHRHGVIHDNIKPSNILVAKGGVAKLCDYGELSHIPFLLSTESKATAGLDLTHDADSIAAAFVAVGDGWACKYHAPEKLRKEVYGRHVDIWSIGCCVLEMGCRISPLGKSSSEPFDTLDLLKIAQLQETPIFPDSLPPHARDFLTSCLAPQPFLRPSTLYLAKSGFLAGPAPVPPSRALAGSEPSTTTGGVLDSGETVGKTVRRRTKSGGNTSNGNPGGGNDEAASVRGGQEKTGSCESHDGCDGGGARRTESRGEGDTQPGGVSIGALTESQSDNMAAPCSARSRRDSASLQPDPASGSPGGDCNGFGAAQAKPCAIKGRNFTWKAASRLAQLWTWWEGGFWEDMEMESAFLSSWQPTGGPTGWLALALLVLALFQSAVAWWHEEECEAAFWARRALRVGPFQTSFPYHDSNTASHAQSCRTVELSLWFCGLFARLAPIVTNNEGGKMLRALEKLLAVGLGLCLPISLWRTSVFKTLLGLVAFGTFCIHTLAYASTTGLLMGLLALSRVMNIWMDVDQPPSILAAQGAPVTADQAQTCALVYLLLAGLAAHSAVGDRRLQRAAFKRLCQRNLYDKHMHPPRTSASKIQRGRSNAAAR